METEVTLEFDDSDVWEAVEDTVRDEITNFIDEHTSEYEHDGIGGGNDVDGQVCELLTEYRNGSAPCDTGDAFEQAVWKAICRLDNPTDGSVWAAAAKEYLLSVATDVRAMVREELFNLGRLGQLRLTVSRPESGAEIAVAPGD
jgi:hypothetical protein